MFLFGITWKIFYSFLIHSALFWWTSTFKIAFFYCVHELFFRFKTRNIFILFCSSAKNIQLSPGKTSSHLPPVLMMLFIFNYAVSFQNFLTSCVCFLSERILHPFLLPSPLPPPPQKLSQQKNTRWRAEKKTASELRLNGFGITKT